MATKPTKYPRWATVPGTDPVSGQPNISEPSEGKKDSGFDYLERPPRQDFNWLQNLNNLWLTWLEQEIEKNWGEESPPPIDAGTGTWSDVGSYIRWHKRGDDSDLIHLQWLLAGTLSGIDQGVINMSLTNVPPISTTHKIDGSQIGYSQTVNHGEAVLSCLVGDTGTIMRLGFSPFGAGTTFGLGAVLCAGSGSFKLIPR